jgi:hypothetical protein
LLQKKYRLGYIPLTTEDPNYTREVDWEIEEGFPRCLCSNCEKEGSNWLIEHMRQLNLGSFYNMISAAPKDVDNLPEISSPFTRPAKETWKNLPCDKPLTSMLESFAIGLLERFYAFYHKEEKKGLAKYEPELYFKIEHAHGITQNLD